MVYKYFRCTTDGASNFRKAFEKYGKPEGQDVAEEAVPVADNEPEDVELELISLDTSQQQEQQRRDMFFNMQEDPSQGDREMSASLQDLCLDVEVDADDPFTPEVRQIEVRLK